MKNKTKILSIHEAWELYKIIHPHFPENVEDMGVFEFISSLVEKMNLGSKNNITKIITLLSKNKKVKIEEINELEILSILVDGFSKNKIFVLCDFFSGITKNV